MSGSVATRRLPGRYSPRDSTVLAICTALSPHLVLLCLQILLLGPHHGPGPAHATPRRGFPRGVPVVLHLSDRESENETQKMNK
jgi:hypothetical protein